MVNHNKLKIAWLASFILLLTASLSKGSDSSTAFGIDIIFHIGIYTILSAVPLVVFRKRFLAFILTLGVAPLGFFFEFLHGTITGYGFKMLDAFFNNVGITLGVIIGVILRAKKYFETENDDSTSP